MMSLPSKTVSTNIAVIYISSKDRISGSYSDFTVRLPRTIPNVRNITVHSVILPLMVYNVNENNNVFSFTDSTSSTYTIVIEPGSYNANTFSVALEDLMNTSSTDQFTVTYSMTTFKFSIVNASSGWSINALMQSSAYAAMCISPGAYLYTCEGDSCSFGIPYHAYIESSALSFSNHHSVPHYYSSNPDENGLDIIAKIPMTSNTGGVIFFEYIAAQESVGDSQHATGLLSQKIDLKLRFPENSDFQILSDWSLVVHVSHVSDTA